MDNEKIASAKAAQLLEEWGECLGLQEWKITLRINCRLEELTSEVVSGESHIMESIKCAEIRVVSPEFYGERIVPFDFEKTLVHELLHLKFSLLQDVDNDLQARYVHQLINDIARALVSAKRRSNEDE